MILAHARLTRRELEVLEQAARGLSAVEAAAETCHVEQTVKFHRANVMAKLGARNIAHAVHLAHVEGLLGRGRVEDPDHGIGLA